jgi:hypothetical protein
MTINKTGLDENASLTKPINYSLTSVEVAIIIYQEPVWII